MIDETRPPLPPPTTRQAVGEVFAYLRDSDHFDNVFFILLSGYAAALWLWETSHRAHLQSYVLTNQIAPEARPSLLLLVLGALAALVIWLGAGMARAAARTDYAAWLDRTSGAALALALLPFLPLLSINGIASARPGLTMGCIALMALISGVAAHTSRWPAAGAALDRRLRDGKGMTLGLALALLLAAGYTIYMAVLTVMRHNAFLTHSFDLGVYDQSVFNLLHTGVMRSTQHGVEAINHMGRHFSPIFYLIAPLYALHQEARTLLLLQSLALGIGTVPVYLLGRRITGSALLGLALSVVYVFYPALHGANTFDFHEIVLATPLLLFSLYFLETGRDRAFLIALLLAVLVKEEVALTAAAIGAYLMIGERRYRLGALLTVLGVTYFLVATRIIMPALGGTPLEDRFAAMMPPGEQGLAAVAQTLLTNPFYTLTLIFSNPDRLIYFSQLFLPLLFTPLFGGIAWVAALPAISVSLLTNAETQFDIRYHYAAIFIPFAFWLAARGISFLLALRKAGPGGDSRLAPGALAVALTVAGVAMNYSYGWVFSEQFYDLSLRPNHSAAVRQCIASIAGIPRDASVSAMSDLVPHLSARRNVYLFPLINAADYIVFDSSPVANFWPYIERDARLAAIRSLAPHLVSGEYGLVGAQDGCLILQRGADPAANSAAIRALLTVSHEAESLPSQFPDSVITDERASEGQARRAASDELRPDEQNALIFGPYDTLFPGAYRAVFFLKHEGQAGNGPAATVDVFSNAAGGALAGLDVPPEQIASDGHYVPAPVDVEIRQLWGDLEYRVLFHGPGALTADRVTLNPIAADFPVAEIEAESGNSNAAFPTVEDEQASGGKALSVEPAMRPGVLAEARIGNLLPGDYRADFTLKAGPANTMDPVVTLEVLSGENIVATRRMSANDLASLGAYQTIPLDFGSERSLPEVTLRLRYDGGAEVWADRMALVYRYQATD